jgi:hypothetical protein
MRQWRTLANPLCSYLPHRSVRTQTATTELPWERVLYSEPTQEDTTKSWQPSRTSNTALIVDPLFFFFFFLSHLAPAGLNVTMLQKLSLSFSFLCLHITKMEIAGDVRMSSLYSDGMELKTLPMLDEHPST